MSSCRFRWHTFVLLVILNARRSSGCFQVSPDAAAVAASVAFSGSDANTFCAAFGGPAACLALCSSISNEVCFNGYLDSLAASPDFTGGTVTTWLVLQFALNQCVDAVTTFTCSDWDLLAPLKPLYQRDILCDSRCSWPALPPQATTLVDNELQQASKELFCARRIDGEYCAIALANVSLPVELAAEPTPELCDYLRDGCATYFRAHLAQRGSSCSSTSGSSISCELLVAQQERACAAAHDAVHDLAFLPELIIAEDELGSIAFAQIWTDANALLSQTDSVPSWSTSSTDGSSTGSQAGTISAGARFKRMALNVTVDGARHRSTVLLVEPLSSAPARGVAMYFHGTLAPGDASIVEQPVILGRTRTNEHVYLAVLCQLGYVITRGVQTFCSPGACCVTGAGTSPLVHWQVVVAPYLGSAPSSATSHAYLDHRVLSLVAVEALRAVQHSLLQRGPSRLRRAPELWLMGGSLGGYAAAAVLRRIQQDATLIRFRATGAFMDAAPLDVSGTMFEELTSANPYPEPWNVLLLGKSLQAYVPDFPRWIREGFQSAYANLVGNAQSLNQLWPNQGYTYPLDVFEPAYQAELRDTSSAIRAAWGMHV